GVPPEAVEALSFALLAQHTLLGLANTEAVVTGARHAVCGGHIVPGRNWPDLIERLSAWTRSPTA
ncbi:MAG TPA: anhydro-N-acetylmuramic acid kinase, partial [Mariprofundaceae bacterium]|nr:anhydro-N-acetylmuramic acid kinase [Mariprofundaceae bacterium]